MRADKQPGATTTSAAALTMRLRRAGWWPWVLIAPLLGGITVFYWYPILDTGYLSLTEKAVFKDSVFVGLDNYAALLQDPRLLTALGNTFAYMGIVLLGVPIAIYLAALLNLPGLRFVLLFRTLFFLPYIAMPAAVAMVWRLIYSGDFGVLNWALSLVGIDGPYWLSTPGLAIVAVAVVGLWASIGFHIIILGAGLKSIPPALYEAAELDGAGRWRRLRSITVPLLTPSIFFVVVVTVLGGFQVFDLVYTILGDHSPAAIPSATLVYLFYREAFVSNNQGYAAAISMVILLLVGVCTAIQFQLQKRWVFDGS